MDNADLLKSAVVALRHFQAPEPTEPLSQTPACQFNPCEPPSTRTAPQFLVPFRRAIVFPDLCLPVDLEGTSTGDPDHPHLPFGPLLYRACRVTWVGNIGQRFQPKEHQVLVLG